MRLTGARATGTAWCRFSGNNKEKLEKYLKVTNKEIKGLAVNDESMLPKYSDASAVRRPAKCPRTPVR